MKQGTWLPIKLFLTVIHTLVFLTMMSESKMKQELPHPQISDSGFRSSVSDDFHLFSTSINLDFCR